MGGSAATRTVAVVAVLALALTACRPVDPVTEPPSPDAMGTVEPTAPVEPITGGTLRFAVGEPETVPFEATDPDSLVVVDALFDSLTAWAPNLAVAPSAAASWETPDDGRTWVFHLRDGATFHDPAGTPVTASDFKFAWELAVAGGDAGFHLDVVEGYERLRAGEASTLRGVRARDAGTLEVRLSEPYGAFPARVAHPALAPVPRVLWLDDPAGFRRRPVGNGPFMAAEALVPGQFLRVQRFEGWRNGAQPALLDEVLFQFLDPDTAFVAFQQGRLQVSPLPETAVDLALQRYGRALDGYHGPGVIDGDTPTVYFLGFDVTSPPFDEPAVRRAVSLAIDREALVEAVLGGHASPARSLVAPAVSGADDICEACVHDPRAAEAIFAEHGVESVTLWFNRDGGHRAVAEQVRQDLMAAGVRRVLFRAPGFPEFVAALEAGEAPVFRFGWTPEYPLADDILSPLFHSGHIPPRPQPAAPEPGDDGADGAADPDGIGDVDEAGDVGDPGDGAATPEPGEATAAPPDGVDAAAATEPGGDDADDAGDEREAAPEPAHTAGDPDGRNYMGYRDAEVDALLEGARATTGGMRRRYLHHRVEDIILNRDQVVVPVMFFRHQRVVGDRVVGFSLNPMGLVDLHRVHLRSDPAASEPAVQPPSPAGRP